MRPLILFAVLALVGCESEGQKAEDRLAMVRKNGGSAGEICTASRAVSDAYLSARDQEHYPLAKVEAEAACNEAALQRLESR